jgi:hypothetical protein
MFGHAWVGGSTVDAPPLACGTTCGNTVGNCGCGGTVRSIGR